MVKELEFKINGDSRGKLVALESEKDIPFIIKRVFYIYGTDNSAVRGCHANRNSEFLLLSVSGQSKVLTDDGRGNKKVYVLNEPNRGLYIPRMYWKEMFDFSDDAVLLVLSSERYDPQEYINSYNVFLDEINKGGTESESVDSDSSLL